MSQKAGLDPVSSLPRPFAVLGLFCLTSEVLKLNISWALTLCLAQG